MDLFEFSCAGNRVALPLHCVQRVVPAALPMPLPGAPDGNLGMLNLHGEPLVVLDLAARFGWPAVPLDPDQRILVIESAGLRMGFPIDEAHGPTTRDPKDIVVVPAAFPAAAFTRGVARLDDGLCLICDPERFLLDEERTLVTQAVEKARHEAQ